MRQIRVRRRVQLMAGAAGLLLVLSACGSDSKKASSPTLSKEYCDGVAHFVDNAPDTESATPDDVKSGYSSFSESQQSTIDLLKSQAPSDAKADVDKLVGFIDTTKSSGHEDLAVGTAAYGSLVDHSSAGCGWTSKSIGAKEFEFTNVPKDLKAGTYAFNLKNDGKEAHVFEVVRVKDGVTKSLDDILAESSENGPPPDVEDVAGAFADGGGQTAAVIDLTKPGRYLYICPLPSSDGKPHFMLGMKGELTVK